MIIASKHFPRIITGAVLVSVLGTALYLSGPYLFGLLLLFTLVGLWEFYAMFWPLKANIGGRILGLALGGLLITAAWMRPEMVVMTLALSTLKHKILRNNFRQMLCIRQQQAHEIGVCVPVAFSPHHAKWVVKIGIHCQGNAATLCKRRLFCLNCWI